MSVLFKSVNIKTRTKHSTSIHPLDMLFRIHTMNTKQFGEMSSVAKSFLLSPFTSWLWSIPQWRLWLETPCHSPVAGIQKNDKKNKKRLIQEVGRLDGRALCGGRDRQPRALFAADGIFLGRLWPLSGAPVSTGEVTGFVPWRSV